MVCKNKTKKPRILWSFPHIPGILPPTTVRKIPNNLVGVSQNLLGILFNLPNQARRTQYSIEPEWPQSLISLQIGFHQYGVELSHVWFLPWKMPSGSFEKASRGGQHSMGQEHSLKIFTSLATHFSNSVQIHFGYVTEEERVVTNPSLINGFRK